MVRKTFSGRSCPRSADGVVWLRRLLLNLYVYSSPIYLEQLNPFELSVDSNGSLSTVCHSSVLDYLQRML